MTTTTDNEATPAAAAVVYGLHGLRVVPVRGKVPPIKAWQDVATNDTAAIRELFARPEHATDGVSIVTGRESGVFVVDVDVANGKPGMESLEELERRIGPLPKGPVARTPSGGIHLYFATDGREIRNSAGNVLGPGLDVRGEGGQVVAPPTCRGDACYRWEEDRSPMDLEPPTAPALLELLAAEPIREPRESRRVDPHTGEILGRDTPAWVNEFNRSHTWPELLAGDGWTHDETDPNGDAHWTRPEKETRKGSSATVYADTDCLHVFTTSIPWLPAGTTVDRYGYMVHRRYGGDFKAAAHALKPSSNGKLRGIVHDVAGLVASTVGAATHAVVTKLRPDEGELEAVNLPDEFWNARRELAHIRQAAQSRRRSPDAVLHVVLSRVAGFTSHTLKLPPLVGSRANLCHFAAVCGPPGSGKSSANAVGRELVPVPANLITGVIDQLPIGTGEGLIEGLFGEVPVSNPEKGKPQSERRQVNWNVVVYVDEGEALTALSSRNGATTLPTLRSIWSDATLGTAVASKARNRRVEAGQYAYGLVLALQPERAGDLLNDAEGGTPQRFSWCWALDPTMPDLRPAWPGALKWSPPTRAEIDALPGRLIGGFMSHEMPIDGAIQEEVDARTVALNREQLTIDSLDGHAFLVRLKIAALLAIIDRRLNVTGEDWALAEIVMRTSDAVRRRTLDSVSAKAAKVEQASRDRHVRKEVGADRAKHLDRVERGARHLVSLVEKAGGEMLVTAARRSMRRYRDDLEEIVEYAVERGWLVEHSAPSHTDQPKRILKTVPR